MSLIATRTPHPSPSDEPSATETEQEFSYELAEELMAVADSDHPTPLLRWMETACLAVPPDRVGELLGELRALRPIAIGLSMKKQEDYDRLARNFDGLIAFVTAAMASEEYVLLSAGVVPTDFQIADTGVFQ